MGVFNLLKEIFSPEPAPQPVPVARIYPGMDWTSGMIIPADVERVFESLLSYFSSAYLENYAGIDGQSPVCQYFFKIGDFLKEIPDERAKIRFLEAIAESCVMREVHKAFPNARLAQPVAVSLQNSCLTVAIAQNDEGIAQLKAFRDAQYVQLARNQVSTSSNAKDIVI